MQPALIEALHKCCGLNMALKTPPELGYFLQAAAEAQNGNQKGPKHGAVLVHGKRIVAKGFNHWVFDFSGKKRVVHAEVHALVNFFKQSRDQVMPTGEPSLSPLDACLRRGTSDIPAPGLAVAAAGLCPPKYTQAQKQAQIDEEWSIWIVELSKDGLGYDSSQPCPQCNKALISCGVAAVHYSTRAGVRSRRVRYDPALRCESIHIALQSELR